jgi:hypothetical protein
MISANLAVVSLESSISSLAPHIGPRNYFSLARFFYIRFGLLSVSWFLSPVHDSDIIAVNVGEQSQMLRHTRVSPTFANAAKGGS